MPTPPEDPNQVHGGTLGLRQVHRPPDFVNITRDEINQTHPLNELYAKYSKNRGLTATMSYPFHDEVVLISGLQARSNFAWESNEAVSLKVPLNETLDEYLHLGISAIVS
jgi:hypothetical protein